VLLAHFHPPSPLLKAMLGEVAGVKEKHGRPALCPHGGP
jgi:hypothetical protein